MHGGKSAPRDTKYASLGPMKGFGRSVYVTVTLPRNETGSNGNEIKVYFISLPNLGKHTSLVTRCGKHSGLMVSGLDTEYSGSGSSSPG